jgi:integrase
MLTVEEEKRFLTCATPYIQDIAVLALNTGLRIGEILSLTWRSVDLENNLLSVFAHKTNKIRAVPINTGARPVLEYWALGRKNEFVFYNHETGNPFVDLKAGFALACRKAGIVACVATYVRISSGGAWRGYSDSPAIARTFDRHCNDALHAYKSRCEEDRHAKTRRF